ncbi:MAG: prolipoprotein diacylglyceryl transferase [Thermodesulfobacteriota bacterium]
MYPDFIKIGNFVISSFGVMVAASFIVAYWLCLKEFRRKNLSEDLLGNLFLAAMVGGIVGAKLLYLLENVPLNEILANPVQHILSRGGLTFYGGLFGAVLFTWLVGRRSKLNFWVMGDAVAPAMAIGYSIGRIGCFLVGDDYGVPSNLPWAMSFPNGLPPTIERVHPTQLYEVIIMGLVFLYLWKIRKNNFKPGYLFSLYLIMAGSERFLIEFVRNTTQSPIPSLSVAQLMAVFIILAGIIKIYRLKYN